jgi:hypothetical protein
MERGSIAFVVAEGGRQNTVHHSCKTEFRVELRDIWTGPNTASRIATSVPLPTAKTLMTTSLAYLFAKNVSVILFLCRTMFIDDIGFTDDAITNVQNLIFLDKFKSNLSKRPDREADPSPSSSAEV